MNKIITRQIVPAEPGWQAMTPVVNEDGKILELAGEPLIAWLITVETTEFQADRPLIGADAITAEGMTEEILRRPDGSLTLPYVMDFENAQAAVDHLNEERANRDSKTKKT